MLTVSCIGILTRRDLKIVGTFRNAKSVQGLYADRSFYRPLPCADSKSSEISFEGA